MADSLGSDVVNFGKSLLQRKAILASAIVACLVLSLVIDSVRTKMYTATATMQLVSQNQSSNGQAVELTPLDIASAIPIVTGSAVVSLVKSAMGSEAPKATVTEEGATNILLVSVTTDNPNTSILAANQYVTSYIQYTENSFNSHLLAQESVLRNQSSRLNTEIASVEQQINQLPKNVSANALDTLLQEYSAQLVTIDTNLGQLQLDGSGRSAGAVVVSPASSLNIVISPNKATDLSLAGVLGVLVAIAIIKLIDFFDDRIRDRDDLLKVVGETPVLGEIPTFTQMKDQAESSVIVSVAPRSAAAESYRSLRTAVQYLTFDTDHTQVIQITSPLQGEGKTTTVIDLAATIASNGARVVLLSCDLRRPSLHRYFPSNNAYGLSNILAGQMGIEEAIVQSEEFSTVFCIPSGPVPPNPSELLNSSKMSEILESLRGEFDFIILDSPALLPITDSIILAQLADIVIVLARADQTRARALGATLDQLSAVNAPVRGVVLNGVASAASSGRRYGSYGRYEAYELS
jgi:capsular exopolysaccharide synthesis family protein